jgi:hypothetical protein
MRKPKSTTSHGSSKVARLDDAYVAASVMVLSQVKHIYENGSIKYLIDQIQDFLLGLKPADLPNPILEVDKTEILQKLKSPDFELSSLYKVINDKKNVSNFVAIALYIYVYMNFRDEFEEYIEVIMRDKKELFVSAVRGFLGKDESNSKESVIPFKGTYLFLQPFHRNPHKQINVCRLSVGTDEDSMHGVHFEQITREFNSLSGGRYTDYPSEYSGKIIPNGVGGYIFLTGGRSGLITIAIDSSHTHPNPHSKRDYVQSFRGTMLVAVGHGNPSSAWPFHAVRVNPSDEDTAPRIIDRASLSSTTDPLMRDVLLELSRGGVVWSHDLVAPR